VFLHAIQIVFTMFSGHLRSISKYQNSVFK